MSTNKLEGYLNLRAPIAPFLEEDRYPVFEMKYGKGGHRTVETLGERNAIYEERREIGMTVYVIENGKTYIYKKKNDLFIWEELIIGEPQDGETNQDQLDFIVKSEDSLNATIKHPNDLQRAIKIGKYDNSSNIVSMGVTENASSFVLRNDVSAFNYFINDNKVGKGVLLTTKNNLEGSKSRSGLIIHYPPTVTLDDTRPFIHLSYDSDYSSSPYDFRIYNKRYDSIIENDDYTLRLKNKNIELISNLNSLKFNSDGTVVLNCNDNSFAINGSIKIKDKLLFQSNTNENVITNLENGNVTNGLSLLISAGSTAQTTINKNGGALILSSGESTGVGSSNIQFKTSMGKGSGNYTPSTSTTKMSILGNGNVGIGMTNPLHILDVNGIIHNNNFIKTNGIDINDTTDSIYSNNNTFVFETDNVLKEISNQHEISTSELSISSEGINVEVIGDINMVATNSVNVDSDIMTTGVIYSETEIRSQNDVVAFVTHPKNSDILKDETPSYINILIEKIERLEAELMMIKNKQNLL